MSLNRCPSLGGTMLDCNDDVDTSAGDYTSRYLLIPLMVDMFCLHLVRMTPVP